MEWTDESIARLRALWAEGHSTAEIGRRMGISKNAVVGKAHRLNLPPRPSPIRRDAEGAPPRRPQPKRVTGPTLPPLAAAAAPAPNAVPLAPPAAAVAAPSAPPVRTQPPAEAVAAVAKAAPVRAVPVSSRRTAACCWPIGEPGTKSFRFCDAAASPNKPYCPEHAMVAYVKVRDRRDDGVRESGGREEAA
jgi:GcrA cell cycle regulator